MISTALRSDKANAALTLSGGGQIARFETAEAKSSEVYRFVRRRRYSKAKESHFGASPLHKTNADSLLDHSAINVLHVCYVHLELLP